MVQNFLFKNFTRQNIISLTYLYASKFSKVLYNSRELFRCKMCDIYIIFQAFRM